MRPDKSGVILFGREIGDLMVIRAVPTQEKIPDPVFQYVCGLARAHNFPVVFSVFEQKNGKYVDHKRGLFASPAISAKLSAEDLEKI